jgi:plastocyanin
MRATVLALVVAALAGPSLVHAQAPAPKKLAESRNNVGVAYDPLSGADFDGAGAAFSGMALQQAGVTPGAPVTSDGIEFVWPDTASGEPDNVEADGQTIAIPDAQDATRLGLLAAAHGGDLSTTLKLNYVDALGETSVEEVKVALGNWTSEPGGSSTHDVSSDFYVVNSTVPVPVSAGLDAVAVPLDPSRTLVSVGLPKEAKLHVFDLSTKPGSAGGGGGGEPQELPVTSTVAALPSGNLTGFAPRAVTVIQGQPLDFANLDPLGPHDVTSVKRGSDYQRLFTSASVPFGQATPVEGVEKLAPGTYDFVCSIHGSMQGQLTVQAGP